MEDMTTIIQGAEGEGEEDEEMEEVYRYLSKVAMNWEQEVELVGMNRK